jgi:hypothetical protein
MGRQASEPREPLHLQRASIRGGSSGEWHVFHDQHGKTVCLMTDTLEIKANAHLIASAPDLLSALERLAHPMADDEDLDFARAIIAKAKGL